MKQTTDRHAESGFTLIEAMTATLVLAFGLMAVTNLFIVSAANNSIGSQGTATATEAIETMEALRTIRFDLLTEGGDLDSDTGSITVPCDRETTDCTIAGNFHAYHQLQGVANIRTRWTIERPGAGGPDTLFIKVRSEALGTLGGQRSRAEFTAFRTCTSDGCDY